MQWLPLGWVDVAMLGVVVVSALVGLLRGITFELLSLAGWFVAYFGGRWLEPFVAPHLPIGAAGSALNGAAAFAFAFLAVLVVWSLLARAVSALIAATPLRPLDRLLGAAFGLRARRARAAGRGHGHCLHAARRRRRRGAIGRVQACSRCVPAELLPLLPGAPAAAAGASGLSAHLSRTLPCVESSE